MDRQFLVGGPLTIEVESQNGCDLVRADGELDLGSVAALEQSLDEALSAHGKRVVLDLADGARLQMLAACSDDVNFLLRLTGIGDRLPIEVDQPRSRSNGDLVEVEMKPDAAGAAGIAPRTAERVDDL